MTKLLHIFKKSARIIIFLIYSWYIYSSFFIIGAPLFLYSCGIAQTLKILKKGALSLPFYTEIISLAIIKEFESGALLRPYNYRMDAEVWGVLILFLGFLIVVYFVPLYIWWKKQTIPRAAFFALCGLIFSPESPFLDYMFAKHAPVYGVSLLLSICLFYALLYWGNEWQKKHYPHCKLANRIRFILKWPCLRT